MKTLNVVLAVAGLFALMPSASVWAAEKTEGTAGVATEVMTRGGKSAPGHAWARAAAAEAEKAAELRAAKRAEEKAGKIAAGEKPAAAAPVVVTAPVKVSAGGGGKSSSAHARARATKATADQAAAQNAE
ncbi:MAG: hypothetical protein H7Y06_12675 [Opitutaceae bacterium]|nr:hypothetical protein [Opitutaceae bacterium]